MRTLAIAVLSYTGRKAIGSGGVAKDIFLFALTVISRIFRPSSYNRATLSVLVSQIYFTAVQVLPLFCLVAIATGITSIGVLVNLLQDVVLSDSLIRVIVSLLITEISPLTTVALIALRSGAAMNTEISVMKINRELKTLELFNIDPVNYLYLPRVLAGVIAMVLLSGLSAALILASGLLASYLFFHIDLHVQGNLLIQMITFSDIFILFSKALIFGLVVTLIPIWFGLTVTDELTSIPVAVLKGMLTVFIAIATVEVLVLTARFA